MRSPSRQFWYRIKAVGVFLLGVSALIAVGWLLFMSKAERTVQEGPLTIREEVTLIERCRSNGDEPWADDRGYVHCRPIVSEVHDVDP